MKRTVEIDDDLQERVDDAKEELRDNIKEYFKENQGCNMETYYQQSEALHEIADSNTPIYYSDIDGLYYLYGNEFDEAYRDAGIGDGKEDNHRQVAIYCYIEQQLGKYYNELETAFSEADSAEEFIKGLD